MKPISFSDYRRAARRRLPRVMFDYIDGGAFAEQTLARNVTDMEAVTLPQRVMRNVSKANTKLELFGQSLTAPIVLAPVGLAGMFARRGEVQAARAAKLAGLPFCLSTVGVCSIEEVAGAAGAPWFQLYMLKDRGYMQDLLGRARGVGCPVLVLTADLPTPGTRYRDIRSGMTAGGLSATLRRMWGGATHPAWAWDVGLNGRPHTLGNITDAIPHVHRLNEFWRFIGANFDPTVTWKDLEFIRRSWDGPIVIKGVLDVDDARDAVSAGADGIVVSNHGGRQLDGAISSIAALPAIAEAVGDKSVVMMDGAVRSGVDVLRALSLGARACLIGRSWVYPLASGGEAELGRALATMTAELRTAMMLMGSPDISRIGR